MTHATFATPREDRCFEDYAVGAAHEFGSTVMDEQAIVDFALRFDPLGYHTDPQAGREGGFGGVIASGWHTAAVTARFYSTGYLPSCAPSLSPGLDELRWLKPVRPGDELWVRVTVLEARRSRSKPGQGLVRSLVETVNQRQETVLSLKIATLLRCRDGAPIRETPV